MFLTTIFFFQIVVYVSIRTKSSELSLDYIMTLAVIITKETQSLGILFE